MDFSVGPPTGTALATGAAIINTKFEAVIDVCKKRGLDVRNDIEALKDQLEELHLVWDNAKAIATQEIPASTRVNHCLRVDQIGKKVRGLASCVLERSQPPVRAPSCGTSVWLAC